MTESKVTPEMKRMVREEEMGREVNIIDKKLNDLPILPEGADPEKSTEQDELYSFTALISWFDDNFQSDYIEGMKYVVRRGNEKLHTAVQDWHLMKMVKIG